MEWIDSALGNAATWLFRATRAPLPMLGGTLKLGDQVARDLIAKLREDRELAPGRSGLLNLFAYSGALAPENPGSSSHFECL